ncbi:MAG: Crp/Fnr family transcriptional regulator [Caloramator sp.]|nr:Crp/Fnr family transcriptional regulator [Caloramator sp.]
MSREIYDKILNTHHRRYFYDIEKTIDKFYDIFGSEFKKVLYLKGEEIERENIKNKFFFLEKGKVAIKHDNYMGRDMICSFVFPGEFFNFSVFTDESTFKYEAAINSCVYFIDRDKILSYLHENVEFRAYIHSLIIKSMDLQMIRQGYTSSGNHRHSFVSFILEYFNGYSNYDDGQVEVELDVNYQEIAYLLNMTRETLSRIVNEFKDNGIIESGRRYLKILDLEKFCG